jgi:hypothetical protein
MNNPTSYFSAPATELDPTLFSGRSIQSWVRSGIISMLSDFLGRKYQQAQLWTHPYLAGSGVSYQWNAAREPKDLDCLIGINFVQFRKANNLYAGLSDREISDQLNEEFHDDLQKSTQNWNGYELTFYALVSEDIRSIKPYAAYDLKYGEWIVTPDPNQAAPSNSEWDRIVDSDSQTAASIENKFTASMQDLKHSRNDATRRNSENNLTIAAAQGNSLYNEIHNNRSLAFSGSGEGYGDFHNYRWQAGKRSGAIQSLRKVREYMMTTLNSSNPYGVELPDASTLIRRAATYRNK